MVLFRVAIVLGVFAAITFSPPYSLKFRVLAFQDLQMSCFFDLYEIFTFLK